MHAKITTRLLQRLTPNERPYDVFDTELTGFLLRVQPTGYMCYYLAYKTRSGRGKRLRIGPHKTLTVAQARNLAQQYAARVVTGEDVQAVKQQEREDAQNTRFQTLAGFLTHKYEPWLLAEHQERRRSIEPLQRLHTNFAEFLERPLMDITPWLIEKWRAEQRKRGKTPAAINRDVTTLRSVLSKAVTWHVIDQHPLGDLKPLKVDQHGTIRYLSDDEERRLRDALRHRDVQIKAGRERGNAWRRERNYAEKPSLASQTYGDHLTPLVLLSLNTGARRGELFGVRWNDVNFQTRTLTIRGDTSKSGQTRHIPLNTEALHVLTAWREQTDGDELMFSGKNGGRLDNVRKAWGGVLKSACIRDFRWHDLRHDFASKLVMGGVPINTVRELLGHTTPAMILRYAHLAPDHKAEAVERLNRPHANATSASQRSRIFIHS
jgi:integrase